MGFAPLLREVSPGGCVGKSNQTLKEPSSGSNASNAEYHEVDYSYLARPSPETYPLEYEDTMRNAILVLNGRPLPAAPVAPAPAEPAPRVPSPGAPQGSPRTRRRGTS